MGLGLLWRMGHYDNDDYWNGVMVQTEKLAVRNKKRPQSRDLFLTNYGVFIGDYRDQKSFRIKT